ncbi:putative reverse transcriptase domain-containing protein [Tanacetum coccineum]
MILENVNNNVGELVVILCPPSFTNGWVSEVAKVFPKSKVFSDMVVNAYVLLDNSGLGLTTYDISLINEDFLSQISWHYDGIDEVEILNTTLQIRPKRKNVARACTAGSGDKKVYAGNLSYCNKCKLHHIGPCIVKCGNCKRVGHMTRDCRTSFPATTQGAPNQNRGNQVGNGEAGERAYALGGGEVNQDPNVVTSAFLLNNRYGSILFDNGADCM